MEKSNDVLNLAKEFATEILTKEVAEEFIYHDLNHTTRVAAAAELIGKESNLSDDDLEIVTIAAWFHDTGYKDGCEKHEAASALLARNFLGALNYPEEKIAKVSDCIMASQMPQNPKNLLEEILCDADLSHLAGKDYAEMSDKMHKEMQFVKAEEISDELWKGMNYQFFKNHAYFTDYEKNVLEPVKAKNLKSIKKDFKKKRNRAPNT